jgi:hypothetical protein
MRIKDRKVNTYELKEITTNTKNRENNRTNAAKVLRFTDIS